VTGYKLAALKGLRLY